MRRLVISTILALGCGKGEESKSAAEPAAPGAAERSAREADAPEPAAASLADAERVDARAWWRHVALGEIERGEQRGEDSVATIGSGDDARVIACAVASLQDPATRDAGYRDAVDDLVLALRDPLRRSGARERLEALTKTERGAWENWIGWHDEHGDFLVYNAELDRVDVDEARKRSGSAPVVGGLQLDVRLVEDRIGQGDPLKVAVRLKNVTSGDAAAGILVDQRLAMGHELKVQLRAHEANNVAAVELRPAPDPGPVAPEDFATLPPGAGIDATIDLAPRLAAPLRPGIYMVRLTYESDDAGADGAAWTGSLPSLRRFVRVVPW